MRLLYSLHFDLLAILIFCTIAGCSNDGKAKFIPPVESARDAIDTMLNAWKSGKAIGPIESVEPAVQPVESRWQTGQKLLNYEILDEIPSDGPTQFRVRLTFAGKPKPEESIYTVLGKDPLYVYWKDDLDKSSQSM
ncbi:MAG: hypothetical protein JWM11_4237 [Planctomycetaceae bacterium]|nr:hypothetical protein [Planctomycetaceae bacterium]